MDPIASTALKELLERMQPKLDAALRAHGVESPKQLPPGVSSKIFEQAMLHTAADSFPGAQIDAMKHGLNAFMDPRFNAAFKKVERQLSTGFDAFGPAQGIDTAIVLAAFGMPVAPVDRKTFKILAEPSNSLDEVISCFSRYKTAYVGYSVCELPFYILVTDCVNSARDIVASKPGFAEVRGLLHRDNVQIPSSRMRPFQHGLMLLARRPGDAVSCVGHHDPSPSRGSVVFYAGWTIGDRREGCLHDGYLPVPLQFVSEAMKSPETAIWIWKPVEARFSMN